MDKREAIYDVRHDYDSDHVLHVETAEDGNLQLTTIDGEQVTTIRLSDNGARALRLAVARWERTPT